ncbi:MAG: beta-ketoacyl synthase N-terminal-like domain-containing protein, partial [Syntrophales bacterium]|nr:beta-ketoacyl synthase N-terminal-like domain-containing protein [Syntrophales bacterium]
GAADYVLAGGADILTPFYYEALPRFRALPPVDGGAEGCRPFDRNRNGAMAGEGSGLLCIESRESAMKRGHRPYCEITGVAMGSSPTKATEWPTDPTGVKRVLNRTLKNAGLAPKDIRAISAAANGSRILDATEAAAYADIFTDTERAPRITSLKGAIGESFSGGGIRACALILSLLRGELPPIMGLKEPIGPLPFVRERITGLRIDHAVLSGVSFGGTYVCLIFSDCCRGGED